MTPARAIPPYVERDVEIARLQSVLDALCALDGFAQTKAHAEAGLARLASENREHVAGEGWVR